MVQYSPLDPNSAEIRLLELLPGAPNTPLYCKLIVVTLGRRPNFEALSYVWGDTTVKRSITVDGDVFQVTTNLEEGLRALRYRRKSRTLWVDAICINQQNVAEKNFQVPLMSSIYREAVRVVAWMGPSNPAIALAVSYAEAYVEKRFTATTFYWLKLKFASKFSRRAKKEKLLASLRAYEGRLDILGLPYWTRMWTYQEYYLPRDEPVCVCGDLEFQTASIHNEAFDRLLLDEEISTAWDANTEAGVLDERDKQRIVLSKKLDRTSPLFPGIRPDNSNITPFDRLSNLLVYTQSRCCFDPRDRIYALYGIASKAREIYPLDYSKPIEQVHLEATAFMIHYEYWLPFYVFGLDINKPLNGSSPSWVPDFSRKLHLHPITHYLSPRDEATLRPATISDDLTTFSVSAWNLGNISSILKLAESALGVLQQLRGLLRKQPFEPALKGNVCKSSEEIFLGVARLSVTALNKGDGYSSTEVTNAFRAIVRTLPEDGQLDKHQGGDEVRSLCVQGAGELAGGTVFTTEDGILGVQVGGRDLEDGDIVAVAPQTGIPLVFRAEPTGTTDEKSEYVRLVGIARIDGLMGNLTPNERLVEEIQNRDLERFLVH